MWSPIAAAALIGGAGTAHAQFSVQPVVISVNAVERPEVRTISIHNESKTALQFRVYLGDFDQEETGEAVFAELGTNPHSCGDKLKVYPDAAVIGPGERQEVRLEVQPSATACWSMVFVDNLVPSPGQLPISQRIGVKVHNTPPGVPADGVVAGVYTVTGAGKPLQVMVEFKNTGGAPLRPKGDLEIRTPAGDVVDKIDVEPFSALPGHTRRVMVPVAKALSPGDYLAVAIVDFGASYLAGGQIAFRVK